MRLWTGLKWIINVKVMKRTILLIFLALSCGSCYVKHTGTPTSYEIIEYPVKNGIEAEYYPSEIILCDERTWVLSARKKDEFRTGLFVTYNSGKNWVKKGDSDSGVIYENLIFDNNALFCSSFLESENKSARIMKSDDLGATWNELYSFNDEIEKFMVSNGNIFVQLYSNRKENEPEFVHSIIYSKDNCKSWIEIIKDESFTSSFSKDIVLDVSRESDYLIVSINAQTQEIDTIRNQCKSPMLAVAGEDILGIWNDRRADYLKIEKDTAIFMSHINYDMIWTSHVPSEIYQYGDVVYTSVLVPSVESNIKMFISTDRAKSWAQVDTKGPMDKEYDRVWTPVGDAWFMAGYDDFMVSYCVGEKDGKRQDFIKIIRPKSTHH